MDIKINRAQLRNKIHGCFIGKNIGGTMGAPFEGKRELLDIPGYTTPKGEPLPNDDLDLQLVWLKAMEQNGPHAISANIIGEYWLTHICPHWNEYGIGKANMGKGILPPLSGELYNDDWRHSNGAWIRSEVWACLAPGFPNISIKYAIMDACIDHGISEGTIGEIFTAALESIAFVENNVRTIIEKALEYIPESSRVARCVRLVMQEYDKKTPYKVTRDLVMEEVADLGWFQAPGNIAFTVIGLLYGEGDMEKSLIYAINCGDDTDCTAATCGAILGIVNGADGVPEDLKGYIGDRIVTGCINICYSHTIPSTCKELTERIMRMLPSVLYAHGVYAEYVDAAWADVKCVDAALIDAAAGVTADALNADKTCAESNDTVFIEYCKETAFKVLAGYSLDYLSRSPRSFEISGGHFLKAVVEYEKDPVIAPGETFPIRITFHHLYEQTLLANVDVTLPEGFTANYRKSVFINYNNQKPRFGTVYEMTVTAGEVLEAKNDITIKVTHPVNAQPLYIPITVLG